MHKRLIRWVLATTIVGGGTLGLSGQWTDPWLLAYVLAWSAVALYGLLGLDEDLARERFHPPTTGADRVALRAVRLAGFGHLAVGALDVGRWHLTTPVPAPVRAVALLGMILASLAVFRAMHENHFFSSVVRIQTERGHHVVDTGLYAVIRHPGYAGMILAMPFSALALGSWTSLAIALIYSALLLRRVRFEDGFLQHELKGYAEYAGRVRYRLIPGCW